MRTKELIVNNKKIEAVLVAGGNEFKIYSSHELKGWVIKKGRKSYLIKEDASNSKTVADYVNMNYQPINLRSGIKERFDELIKNLTKNKRKEEYMKMVKNQDHVLFKNKDGIYE